MRQLPTRAQALEVAKQVGAVSYSSGPMRMVKGVSFTFEQLDKFVSKMINPNTLLVDVSETTQHKGLCNEISLQTGLPYVQGETNE